ncbi:LLM class flavin-dependent oxidoreductase [Lentzea flaviverrucosa]|uniref:Luciferase family oxidoreductase, group 1 n=1 Tax=Lentzea flaviverrucosa TaxID=200379 RepID=A0A1H9VRA2_9PSEU|nr:LLM class flavin-dependent oxidoreductase [Lentzea flaviverrucosa]RDI23684.1 luciferase family oxidoreductase group 1 [Lentzea flaviverrucosa]SES24098.1 luciferase family oxidoreductase, group 1 [Lentzea flaviverrucosa]
MSRLSEIPLSVLDLAPITSGSDATTALRNSRELAQQAERLGYHRYWFAEHHNMPGIASSAPAVLIGHIADATRTIRVGSGGVMLPNHAPLVVAEQFGMLEALHPGRIDLGIGRAPGTDQKTARALRRTEAGLSAENFPQELTELIKYFEGTAELNAVPAAGNKPPIWLLGSSGYSAQAAGVLGLPFAFAHHFSAQNTLPALELYRRHFRPSEVLDEPYAMVCASVVVADTDEHARYIAGPGALSFVRLRQGRPAPLATPQEAADYPYTEIDELVIEDRMASQVIGSPSTVRAGLDELMESTAADELMVTTIVHGHDDRLRSFELLAGLAERTPSLGRSAAHT